MNELSYRITVAAISTALAVTVIWSPTDLVLRIFATCVTVAIGAFIVTALTC